MDLFLPELVTLAQILLVILGTALMVVYFRYAKSRLDESHFFQRYRVIFDVLDEVVTATVMRIAFSQEDLSAFEQEAAETGRDVRLVAAMYLIDRFTSENGIELDEEFIISKIEAKLEQLKQDGVIPSK